MRRVVVTGLGMVTPLASGVEQTWARLLAGESGHPPDRAASMFPTCPPRSAAWFRAATAIGEFRPTDYVEAKELRRNDDFIVYGIAAAVQAVEDFELAARGPRSSAAGPACCSARASAASTASPRPR